MRKLSAILSIILAAANLALANPIPWPLPASMPLEDMKVEIKPANAGLAAAFTGEFTFTHIPQDVYSMLFPVPPDANSIRLWQDNVERTWDFSNEKYPTILPEMPKIPMIKWQGPFPEDGAVFRVDYEHNLIKRPKEFIFFYALGTGKYFPTYEKTTTANFDILLPAGFKVAGVWLDNTPHEYEVIGSHLIITVQSYFGPITNDLIVSLMPTFIYVATDGHDVKGDGSAENPFRTIQKGIDAAADGYTVIVKQGTFVGNGNRDIDFKGKAITVRSMDPGKPDVVANTIIDCEGTEAEPHRGFYFHSGEGQDSVVSGFTITGGYASSASPEQFNWSGGAILCRQSSPTIKNCIITDNTTLNGTGGGIRTDGGVITNCTIEGNYAIGLGEYGPGGGGISCGSNTTVSNCAITGNTAATNGGGIRCTGNATVMNCTIVRNSAESGGGIGCQWWGDAVISNCTITGNSASSAGGGISCLNSSPTLVNCILWGDTSGQGPEIDSYGLFGSFPITISFSDVQGGQAAVSTSGGGSLIWGLGNIDADPFFADPSNDDYHLQSAAGRWDPLSRSWVIDVNTSPCIDAGDPNSNLAGELWPHGKRVNMGAFGGTPQASMSLLINSNRVDLNNNDIVNFQDFSFLADSWQKKEVLLSADFDHNGVVDFSDLSILADNWLNGAGEDFAKPTLAKYYVPYDNPAEPNAPGYTLPLNLNDIGNYAVMDSKFGLKNSAALLEQNGFAVIEHDFGMFDPNRDDIVKPYEYLRMMDVPVFVTADTLLHLYHVQFDETLKDIEEREFYGDIRDLTASLLTDALAMYEEYAGDLKEAAKRNVAYLAVAQKLIDPSVQTPALVTDIVAGELAKIDVHEGFAESDIFIYMEDYSQYVPRGHYTRSDQLKLYFRTLMWYGRMSFLLKGAENWGPMCEALISIYDAKIQTMQAVLLARSIENIQVGQRSGREVWDRMYAVTAFYVGLADDLTPYEYIGAVDKVFGSSFEPTDLLDEDNFFSLKIELALLRSPKIFGGTGNVMVTPPITPESLDEVLDKTKGMRFMGQRFIPDSYMFQHLVFPEVLGYTGDWEPPLPFTLGETGLGPGRCYPRGLDVMAILGSARARAILVEEGDTDYIDYWLRFNKLKAEFDDLRLSDWNQNLYWSWLYSLRALINEFGEGYPNFMRTEAWEKKELNAALASWAELRHDTILYAKQSYTPVGTGLPPAVTGYVEPVPEFYGRLQALTRMTREGLSDLNALLAQATERLVNLEDILNRIIEIANKELTNQTLSEADHGYIRQFGKMLKRAVIEVEEKGVKTTLIADVHTHTFEKQVVEEGVGYVDLIIVACPTPDGSIFLAAGPVLSYYEFKHPMSDRLTDEAWRELLASPAKPNRPKWFQPFVH